MVRSCCGRLPGDSRSVCSLQGVGLLGACANEIGCGDAHASFRHDVLVRHVLHHVRQRRIECGGDASQRVELRIRLSAFDFPEITRVYLREIGEVLLADAELTSEFADSAADCDGDGAGTGIKHMFNGVMRTVCDPGVFVHSEY